MAWVLAVLLADDGDCLSDPGALRDQGVLFGEVPRRLILDIDATLLTAHSEKEGAAGTCKGGFGFHPLLCFEATTAEALAGVLRPATPAPTPPQTTSRCSRRRLPSCRKAC